MGMSTAETGRLETIKQEGRRRRAHRYRRNTTLAALTAVVVAGTGGLLLARDSSTEGPVAAHSKSSGRCVNSTDPDCGPFRWSQSPSADQPLKASLTVTPAGAARQVQAVVEWSDGDASRLDVADVCWGDGSCPAPTAPCVADGATGRWEPPPAEAGHGQRRFEHTYASPGTYTVSIRLRSAAWPAETCAPPNGDPYASTRVVERTVSVS
jgi:hypothetical protein